MDKREDGGPAFPLTGPTFGKDGMTLRDWLAGQALAGLAVSVGASGHRTFEEMSATCARASYELSDAMLAARKAVS